MTTSPTSRTQRALDNASAMGGSAQVTWARSGWRRVRGSTGRKYWVQMVTSDWRTWTCECEAGQRGLLACWHRGACFLAQLRDQSRGGQVKRSN